MVKQQISTIMPIAFTICSNNYLAKANVAAKTFIDNHASYFFFIFIVDEFIPEIDYNAVKGIEMIAVKTIVPYIDELARKYSIVELNTAVKPALFTHLFDHHQGSHILYLDPDLMIFDHFSEIEALFENESCNIIVTPHFCSPIDDGKIPSEIHLSVYGLYNLGFLAVRHSGESQRFLNWWHDRLMKYCYIAPEKGMFTDQLWINHAPVYFNGVYILKHLGYNVANWNLYERDIDKIDDTFYVNGKEKLKFFHFSHYKFHDPYLISSQQNRHKVDDFKYMRVIIDQYQSMLIEHNHEFFNTIPCYYQLMYEYNQKQQDDFMNAQDKPYIRIARKLKNKAGYFVRRFTGS